MTFFPAGVKLEVVPPDGIPNIPNWVTVPKTFEGNSNSPKISKQGIAMALYIHDFESSFVVDEKNKVRSILRLNHDGFNLFYVTRSVGSEVYPLLSILVNNELTNVNFNSDGVHSYNALAKTQGENIDGDTIFKMFALENGDLMPNTIVIPLNAAVQIVEEFFDSASRPICVDWEEL